MSVTPRVVSPARGTIYAAPRKTGAEKWNGCVNVKIPRRGATPAGARASAGDVLVRRMGVHRESHCRASVLIFRMKTTEKQSATLDAYKERGREMRERETRTKQARSVYANRCRALRKTLGLRWFEPTPKIIGRT